MCMPDDQDHACKMQQQTSETRRWICPPTAFGDPLTTDHKILNLDDESINDHWAALLVQNGYLYWRQSYPTKSKDAAETRSSLQRLLPPFKKTARIFTDRQLNGVINASEDQHIRAKKRKIDSDGSNWPSRRMMGLYDGMSLLRAERARQHGRWQDSM